MKQCPFCKSEILEGAIRCPHCTSFLDGEKGSATTGQVTYVFDRDLVRFLKFSGSVLAIFLIVGAFVVGFDIKKATEDIKKATEDVQNAKHETKQSELDINGTKNNIAQLAQETTGS